LQKSFKETWATSRRASV